MRELCLNFCSSEEKEACVEFFFVADEMMVHAGEVLACG